MFTFNEAQIMAWFTPIFWPFLRTLAVLSTAPILSSKSVPVRTKVALAFVIAVCMQPSLTGQAYVELNSPRALEAVVQQFILGAAIGLTVRIVFSAVEMAGEFIGLQMGLNFAGFFDPTTNSQTSTVGRFFGNVSMFLFLVLNGHLLIIMSLADSFRAFPVGTPALEALGRLRLHELGGLIFSYGLWIALPLIGLLLFINIMLGIISRVAPQMNVFAIGFPLTLSAGLLGIALTLPMMDRPIMQLMRVIQDLFVG